MTLIICSVLNFWPIGLVWVHFDRGLGVLDMIVPISFLNMCCWLKKEKSVPVLPVKERKQSELDDCYLIWAGTQLFCWPLFCSLFVYAHWDYCVEGGCRG